MRSLVVLVLFIVTNDAMAQTQAEKLRATMERFHQLLVNPGSEIERYIDDSLSYGHSNGWVESRKEFRENLGTKLVYFGVVEDSVDVTVNGKMAHVRFNGDYEVLMNGNRVVYQLKVLEVWVRKKTRWVLFARQAVKRP